jgi:uncharacterized protein
METPCINVCVIDPVSGLCIGCGRNTSEIGGWMAMPAGQRRDIMQSLPERMKTMTSRASRCTIPQRGRTPRTGT